MPMHRTYGVDTGDVAISATGQTPMLYFSVPSTADGNLFKLVPSIEAGSSVPTVPSNSSVTFGLFVVTGTVGGGASLTPKQLEGNVLASNLTVKSGSTALTGLTQGAYAGWLRTIPFTVGAFQEADHENTAALEVPLLPSTLYAVYFNIPSGPGAGRIFLPGCKHIGPSRLMTRDTPAEFRVGKVIPGGGSQTIFACSDHLAATVRQLNPEGAALAVLMADPSVHSCKGCDADWPTG